MVRSGRPRPRTSACAIGWLGDADADGAALVDRSACAARRASPARRACTGPGKIRCASRNAVCENRPNSDAVDRSGQISASRWFLFMLLRAVDLLDRIARLDRAAERVDRVGRVGGDAARDAGSRPPAGSCAGSGRPTARSSSRSVTARSLLPASKPLPTTYCSIEIWRLDCGLRRLRDRRTARARASISFLKSGPWNSLPTKLPPARALAIAISSARSNSASERA